MAMQSTQSGTEQQSEQDDEEVILTTTPNIRPVLLRLGVTVALGIIAIGVFYLNPQLFGSTEVTNVGLIVVQLLVVIAILRLVVKIIILLNTQYILTERAVTREYELLARAKSREVPYDLVRSQERTQGRIEYLLGIGSISLNQGLGDLRLEFIPNHDEVYEQLRKRIESQ